MNLNNIKILEIPDAIAVPNSDIVGGMVIHTTDGGLALMGIGIFFLVLILVSFTKAAKAARTKDNGGHGHAAHSKSSLIAEAIGDQAHVHGAEHEIEKKLEAAGKV